MPGVSLSLRCCLNDELRRVGSGFAAGKADCCAARCRERQVIRSITRNVGGDIHTDPYACTKGATGAQRSSHRGRVAEIDRRLRPGVVAHTVSTAALAGGAICKDAQGGTGDGSVQPLYTEPQITAHIGGGVNAQSTEGTIISRWTVCVYICIPRGEEREQTADCRGGWSASLCRSCGWL